MLDNASDARLASSYVGHDQLVAMQEAHNYNAMIVSMLDRWLGPHKRLVDIGAGVGDFAQRMQEHGHGVEAVEPDAAQRALIMQRGIACANAVEHYPRQHFDGAYSLNVLEHIEDDLAALRAWSRVLRDGGVMFLYVPAFPVLYSAMDRAVGHYRRYTRRSLESRVREAGLSVIASGYADSLGFPASLALRVRGGDGSLSASTVRLYDRVIFPWSRRLDPLVGKVFGKNVWVAACKTTP